MKPNSEAKPLPPPSSKNGAAEARLNSEAVAVDLIERAANVEIQGHEAAFYRCLPADLLLEFRGGVSL